MSWKKAKYPKDWSNGERVVDEEEAETGNYLLSVYRKLAINSTIPGSWYASVRWHGLGSCPEGSAYSLRAFGLPTERKAKAWAHQLHNYLLESL